MEQTIDLRCLNGTQIRVVPQYLQDRLLQKQWRAMVAVNQRQKELKERARDHGWLYE